VTLNCVQPQKGFQLSLGLDRMIRMVAPQEGHTGFDASCATLSLYTLRFFAARDPLQSPQTEPTRSDSGEALDTHNSKNSRPHSSHTSTFGPIRKSGCPGPQKPWKSPGHPQLRKFPAPFQPYVHFRSYPGARTQRTQDTQFSRAQPGCLPKEWVSEIISEIIPCPARSPGDKALEGRGGAR